jgi:hypothetical protein
MLSDFGHVSPTAALIPLNVSPTAARASFGSECPTAARAYLNVSVLQQLVVPLNVSVLQQPVRPWTCLSYSSPCFL